MEKESGRNHVERGDDNLSLIHIFYNYLNELALESKPGSNGLFFFPYLLGERAPIWDEAARGMFIGMGINTTRSDIIRSIFEGTAFALRNVMETVKESGGEANILRICGGGAKSYTWSQIKACLLYTSIKIWEIIKIKH